MDRSNDNTKRYLQQAGIVSGMRVLELGCGNGEVTQLLASIVGDTGYVCAVDRESVLLEAVQSCYPEKHKLQTQFIELDVTGSLDPIEKIASVEPFDAIVCRRLLMYLKSPAKIMERFHSYLREYAIFVVEEIDLSLVPDSTFESPARDLAIEWIKKMLVAEKADYAIGKKLPDILGDAGFDVTTIGAEAVIEGQGNQFPLDYILFMVKERLQSAKIASEDEIKQVIEEARQEAKHIDNVYISSMSFYAMGYRM